MENIKVIFEGSNLLIFLIVLVAIMGIFVLVGSVIKTFREIRQPKNYMWNNVKTDVMNLQDDVAKIEGQMKEHKEEIEEIRHSNRIQCQAVRALLNHAIHNGNTEEMQRAAGALDDYLTEKI